MLEALVVVRGERCSIAGPGGHRDCIELCRGYHGGEVDTMSSPASGWTIKVVTMHTYQVSFAVTIGQ